MITEKSIMARLKRAHAKRRAELMADIKRYKREAKKESLDSYYNRTLLPKKETELANLSVYKSLSIPYQPRKRMFKGCNGKLEFNPATMLATSYKWYELVKVIKGKVVVNTYAYSHTTTGHVYAVQSLLSDLGIRYVEVQAPKGLQNLAVARTHHVERYNELRVRKENGRKQERYKAAMAYHARCLKLLESFGFNASETMHAAHYAACKEIRLRDLAEKRKRNAYKRVEIIIDTENKFRDAIGIHHVSGTPHIGNYEKTDLAVKAADKGLKHVYIHVEPWREVAAKVSDSDIETETYVKLDSEPQSCVA